MSDQPKAPCFAADGKEPVINAGFGYPLMVSAVAFNRQHARIEADEALMPMLLDALESCDPGDFSTGHVIHASYNESLVEAAITALRKRLESSNG